MSSEVVTNSMREHPIASELKVKCFWARALWRSDLLLRGYSG